MQKRFEMRRSTRIQVEVLSPVWEMPMHLMTGDLSPRGLYLESEELLAPDMPVICSFELSRGYHLTGKVSRVNHLRRRSDRGRPGFGVAFTYTRPLTRISLRSDLRGLPPPIPARRAAGIWLPNTQKFIVM
jgi:hypothetical protein